MQQNGVGVLVLPVAKGRCSDQSLFLLLTIACADFFADVLGVVVIHQAADTDDQIIFFAEGVHSLRGRDDAHIFLPEIVDEQCGLGSMAAEPRYVLDDDGVYFISVRSCRGLIQPSAVEFHAADIVIEGLSLDDIPILSTPAPAE